MAGDWIKLTHAVLDKPEIRKTARMLGVKHGEALELYLRWWVWLDVNSVDGLVDQYVDQDVDDLLHCDGISACMREVGWLTTDPTSGKLRVSGFDTHNGETSKKRALKNKAQANWRANVDESVDQIVDQPRSTKASTREEKRRDIKRERLNAPTEEHADIARRIGIDCGAEWQKYLDHQSNAKNKHTDLVAGFRNWLKRADEFRLRGKPTQIHDKRAAAAAQMRGSPKDNHEPTDITAEIVRIA